jgi:hypothetical protein
MSAISIANLPLSTTTTTPLTSRQTYFKERAAEVKQLSEALKSGDLAAAQQDYNNIVALGNKDLHKDNPYLRADRGLDFNAIGGALQNGDLAGAQQAFAVLESTYKVPPADSSTTASSLATASQSGVNVIA